MERFSISRTEQPGFRRRCLAINIAVLHHKHSISPYSFIQFYNTVIASEVLVVALLADLSIEHHLHDRFWQGPRAVSLTDTVSDFFARFSQVRRSILNALHLLHFPNVVSETIFLLFASYAHIFNEVLDVVFQFSHVFERAFLETGHSGPIEAFITSELTHLLELGHAEFGLILWLLIWDRYE